MDRKMGAPPRLDVMLNFIVWALDGGFGMMVFATWVSSVELLELRRAWRSRGRRE